MSVLARILLTLRRIDRGFNNIPVMVSSRVVMAGRAELDA
jgi:hypothetical protein